MDAYILCGGKGTRVAELCKKYNCEKSELPVDGHKLVEYTIRSAFDSNIIRKIQYIREQGTGTGGAVRCIGREELDEPRGFPYLLVYGDMYVDLDIGEMYGAYLRTKADLLLVTMETEDQDYGMVEGAPWVISYSRRHAIVPSYLTNVGMYLIGEDFHTFLQNYPQPDPFSLEVLLEDPNILGTGMGIFKLFTVTSYRVDSRKVYDVGTVGRFWDTNNRLKWIEKYKQQID